VAPWEPRYHDLPEIVAQLEAWRARAPGDARLLALGPEGDSIPALVFGAAGERPLDERPTVFLVGGVDGVSFAGGEAVLACTAALLAELESLPVELAFVSIPWAAPAALARASAGAAGGGRAPGDRDQDGDGVAGEDWPDDVDGDGLVLAMLLEDPDGPWTLAGDGRLLVPARAGDAARYRRVPEGLDDDGDGRFNEDDGGGVCFDAHFPLGWDAHAPGAGAWPLRDPRARALASALGARPCALVLVFQGNHGGLAVPAGEGAGCGRELARIERSFASLTGRREALRARAARGDLAAWCRATTGALVLEVAPWGPRVALPALAQPAEQVQPTGPATVERALLGDPLEPWAELDEEGRAWRAWLDEARGGLGFVDWRPVDLGQNLRGLVGGWQPCTYRNPPEEDLARALAGLPEFTLALARAQPRLELGAVRFERDGELVRLSAHVANRGQLSAGDEADPAWVALELPGDGRLVAGPARVACGALAGGARSRTLEWIVAAPEGVRLVLRAGARRAAPVEREVRP
jgi:hypothetical protein